MGECWNVSEREVGREEGDTAVGQPIFGALSSLRFPRHPRYRPILEFGASFAGCFPASAACLAFFEAAFFWLAVGLLVDLRLPLVSPCRFRYKRMQIGNAKTLVGAHQGFAITMQRSTQSCPNDMSFWTWMN